MDALEENRDIVSTFKWHLGRLDNPQMTSLRRFSFYPVSPNFNQRKTQVRLILLYLGVVFISFSTSVWMGIILLLLPFYVFFCAGMVQHLLFRDEVNKKFDAAWRVSAAAIETVLQKKELPFERKDHHRKIIVQLAENDVEIVITPCQSYIHPRTKQLRWIVTTKGVISDIVLRPLIDDTSPLIHKLTLEIDAEIEKSRQQLNEQPVVK
ncbi:MAG: hypothetical protein AAF490_15515 [Chloroflexota bacterium]